MIRALLEELARLRNLATTDEMHALAAKGRGADIRPEVNSHIHLPPNFSAFDSVAQAVSLASEQGVGIVGVTNYYDYRVYGDFAVRARNAGIVAAVTDGLVRDIGGIDAVGIPTFAAGLTPNSTFKNGPGSVGLPISLGGVTVDSSDLVIGDDDGVVVVPSGRVSDAIAQLAAIAEKESSMDEAVRAGACYPAWLDGALETVGVRYVE